MEVGTPMVCNIAVSRNGKWIVSAMGGGQVQVWNADESKKVTETKGR